MSDTPLSWISTAKKFLPSVRPIRGSAGSSEQVWGRVVSLSKQSLEFKSSLEFSKRTAARNGNAPGALGYDGSSTMFHPSLRFGRQAQ
jgi:hypothetical protein